MSAYERNYPAGMYGMQEQELQQDEEQEAPHGANVHQEVLQVRQEAYGP